MYKNSFLTILIFGFFFSVNAKVDSLGVKEESNIYEKIYNTPINVVGEKQLYLQELYSQKPMLLALVFTRCSGVCNPFLLQLKENIQLRTKDNSFNVLVLSFDPRDRVNDMNILAQRFGVDNNKQWIFGITDSILKLNQSINFNPVWDSISYQYDHDALLVGINNEGYITKKLIGLRQGHDFDLLIASVNNIFSPTYRIPNKNMLFSCFNYDPKTGENKLGLGLLFIALPAVLTVLLLVFISYFVRDRSARIKNELDEE